MMGRNDAALILFVVAFAARSASGDDAGGQSHTHDGAVITDENTVTVCPCGTTMPTGPTYTNGSTVYLGNQHVVPSTGPFGFGPYPRQFGSNMEYTVSTNGKFILNTISYHVRLELGSCSSSPQYFFSRNFGGYGGLVKDCRVGIGILDNVATDQVSSTQLTPGVPYDITVVVNQAADGDPDDPMNNQVSLTYAAIYVNGVLDFTENAPALVPTPIYGQYVFKDSDACPTSETGCLEILADGRVKYTLDGQEQFDHVQWIDGMMYQDTEPPLEHLPGNFKMEFGFVHPTAFMSPYRGKPIVRVSSTDGMHSFFFLNFRKESSIEKTFRIGAGVDAAYTHVNHFQGKLHFLIIYNYKLNESDRTLFCKPCAEGFFQEDPNRYSCDKCHVGSHSFSGACNCTDCPLGTHDHDQDSVTQCENCVAGTFCQGKDFAPVTCPIGRVDGDLNPATPCHYCGWAGPTSLALDSSNGLAIVGGDYCSGGSHRVLCSAGFSDHDNNASTPCKQCEEDTYCHGADDTTPLNLPANAASKKQCTLNSTSPAGSSKVTDCQCMAGVQGNILSALDTCDPCSQNTFKADIGPVACKACPLNSVNQMTGSTTGADCHCDKGYGGTDALVGSNGEVLEPAVCQSCIQFATGTFKDVVGGEACKTCATGKTTNGICSTGGIQNLCDHVTDCICDVGYGTPECSVCPHGKFKQNLGPASCTQCAVGTYVTPEASRSVPESCISCAIGTYDDDRGPTTPCVGCEDPAGAGFQEFSTGSYCAGGAAYRSACDNTRPYYMFCVKDSNDVCDPTKPCVRKGPSQANLDMGHDASITLGGCSSEFFTGDESSWLYPNPCGSVCFTTDGTCLGKKEVAR